MINCEGSPLSWNLGLCLVDSYHKECMVESCTNMCLSPIQFSIWHLWRWRLEHESQILPAVSWDSPEENACDLSVRNSQELSGEIKLICRPQASLCKHAANMNTVSEIGLFLSLVFLSFQYRLRIYIPKSNHTHANYEMLLHTAPLENYFMFPCVNCCFYRYTFLKKGIV